MQAVALILLLSLFFYSPVFARETGKDVIIKLEKKIDGLRTIKAQFIQKAHISVAGIFKEEESRGIFYLKKIIMRNLFI